MVALLYQSNTVAAMKFAGDRSIVRKEDAPLRCGRARRKRQAVEAQSGIMRAAPSVSRRDALASAILRFPAA